MIRLEQVKYFAKGCKEEQYQDWLNTYSIQYEDAIANGIPELDAERAAVLKTHAIFNGEEQKPQPLEFSTRKKTADITLSEILAENPADPYQMVLPIGLYFSGWYGPLVFTEAFLTAMDENRKALLKTMPFLDIDHDRGEAMGWFNDAQVRENGYFVRWDFTEEGRKKIFEKAYRYYSASIHEVMNPETGEYVWPVFVGAALTNSPAMKTMDEAHLSDKGAKVDPIIIQEEKTAMDFNELKKLTIDLSDSQKKELASLIGVDKEVKMLSETNKDLSERLTLAETELAKVREGEKKAKIDFALKSALDDGRILPKDKDKWEKNLSEAFEIASGILADLPKAVDYSEKGTGDAKKTYTLSATEKKIAQKMGYTEEEAIKVFSGEQEVE